MNDPACQSAEHSLGGRVSSPGLRSLCPTALPRLVTSRLWALVWTALALLGLGGREASAQSIVWTDALDYPPGSTVLISGAGFVASDTVTLQVIHLTNPWGEDDGLGHEPFFASTDALGDFSAEWYVELDDSLGSTFLLTADDGLGNHAEATFTDGLTGAIFTTDGLGNPVNQNIYDFRDDVYLNGGPNNAQAQGLPPGDYFFQVTDPNGGTLLSTDDAACRQLRVNLCGWVEGPIGSCQHDVGLSADVVPGCSIATVGLFPFDYTPNSGGEYKVSLIRQPPEGFCYCGSCVSNKAVCVDPNDPRVVVYKEPESKSDNFKVLDDGGVDPTPTPTPEPCQLSLICPDDVSVGTDPGVCSASAVDLGAPVVTATNCVDAPVVSNDGQSVFFLGDTSVVWSATADGVSVDCTQNVEVFDDEDPTISCPGDIVQNHDEGSCTAQVQFAAESADNCPGVIHDCAFPSPFDFSVGVTSNSCTATDSSGRTASCGFDISVLADVRGVKSYDADVDGTGDASEPGINNWRVDLSGDATDTTYTANTGDVNGTFRFNVLPGTYTVTEQFPNATWLATSATSATVTLTAEHCSETVAFTNVCLGAGGGHTLGYWSNKNGQATLNDGGTSEPELAMLADLCLASGDGSAFNPTAYKAFRTWILSATATNMSFMLSAQLAAMELNVEAGMVSDGSIVYAPSCGSTGVGDDFATIGSLMDTAEAALCADSYTPDGDPHRSGYECLKTSLDRANNNLNFVQSAPCPFPSPY